MNKIAKFFESAGRSPNEPVRISDLIGLEDDGCFKGAASGSAAPRTPRKTAAKKAATSEKKKSAK